MKRSITPKLRGAALLRPLVLWITYEQGKAMGPEGWVETGKRVAGIRPVVIPVPER